MGNLSQQRLTGLLEAAAKRGQTQQEIAVRTGLPAQYLSDVKRGRRPLTELVARRLAQEFAVNFAWLMGTSTIQEASLSPHAKSGVWLPLFPHPVEGDPQQFPNWNGAGVELSGAAAAKVTQARWAYVLQFGHDDAEGRLHAGDLILISQTTAAFATISVVRNRQKLFLVRPQPDGTWQRVANRQILPANCAVVGHCIGVVWSSLLAISEPSSATKAATG